MSDALGLLYDILKAQAFFVLGIQSLYRTLQLDIESLTHGNALRSKSPLRLFLDQFRKLLGPFGVLSLIVLVASGILSLVGFVSSSDIFTSVPANYLSNGLLQSMVLFFSIELLYLFVSKWLRPDLRNNPMVRRLVDMTALSGSLIIAMSGEAGCLTDPFGSFSCNFSVALDLYVVGMFLVIMFITGIGSIGLINTISESLSSHIPRRRAAHYLYLLMLVSGLVGLYTLGRLVPYFGVETVLAGAGLEIAFGVGIAYFVYRTIRNRRLEFSPTLLYVVLIISLSGLFLAYNAKGLHVSPDASSQSSLGFVNLMIKVAIPLILFGIGFTHLIMEMPKKLEEKLGISQSRAVPIFTFLLMFSGLASLQLFGLTNLISSFLTIKEGPAYYGLLFGAVYFTASKLKTSARKSRLKQETIVPFCQKCGEKLEVGSEFCWNCGNNVSHTAEQVLYVGNAQTITTRKSPHSYRRKFVTLLVGGPLGYLAFGRDSESKSESEGQIAVTSRAIYFGGKAFPLSRIARVERGHYSNSLLLDITTLSAPKEEANSGHVHAERRRLEKVELKSNDYQAISQALHEAKSVELPA